MALAVCPGSFKAPRCVSRPFSVWTETSIAGGHALDAYERWHVCMYVEQKFFSGRLFLTGIMWIYVMHMTDTPLKTSSEMTFGSDLQMNGIYFGNHSYINVLLWREGIQCILIWMCTYREINVVLHFVLPWQQVCSFNSKNIISARRKNRLAVLWEH